VDSRFRDRHVVLAPAQFRADAGSARLLGTPAGRWIGRAIASGGMQRRAAAVDPTAGVNGAPGWAALFSSHPPIEERIAALQGRTAIKSPSTAGLVSVTA